MLTVFLGFIWRVESSGVNQKRDPEIGVRFSVYVLASCMHAWYSMQVMQLCTIEIFEADLQSIQSLKCPDETYQYDTPD